MPIQQGTHLLGTSAEDSKEVDKAYKVLREHFDIVAKEFGERAAIAALGRLEHSVLLERYQVETGVIVRS